MKYKHFSKNGILAALPVGCVAGMAILSAQAQEEFNGTIDLKVGGADVSGDQAAFQRRAGQNGDFYGGISNLSYLREVGDVVWTLEGKALFGNEDYEFILGAAKEGTGYLELGYSQFRTWYDGSGGYLPGATPDWVAAANDELHLDRGEIWLEAGLRQEDQPAYTFRYSHKWRDGQKDSTIWGRGSSGGINPTLNNIDETTDSFQLDIDHTIGDTDLGFGIRYETTDLDNSRVILENTTHKDVYDADLFNAHAYSVSRLNDQMTMSLGYSVTTMDTDTTGSNRLTASGLQGHDFWDAVGGGSLQMQVVNANFWWNPTEDLVVVPSIRIENEQSDATGLFWEQPHRGAPEYLNESSESDYTSFTEQLDLRYTGLENIQLYAKLVANQTDGDTRYDSVDIAVIPLDPHHRVKELESTSEKYVLGASWYALKNLSVAAEYYHKKLDADYDNELHGMDAHLASHDIATDDVNVRLTWRALPNLTLVTRYDWQDSSYDSAGIDGTDTVLAEIEAGQFKRSIISQSVTYLPAESLYVTGFVSYIWSDTATAASDASNNLATMDNDYLTAGLTVGYALDDKTDLTAGCSCYYSDNFVVPTGAVGYGTDLEEYVFQVGLNRQINSNMIWTLGYGYYTSNDGTSGGNNDFDAHMVSTGLQVRF